MTISPGFPFLPSLPPPHRHVGGDLEIRNEESIHSGENADFNKNVIKLKNGGFRLSTPGLVGGQILDCASPGFAHGSLI